MRGDAVLGGLVHLDGSNLNLDGPTVGTDHRGVQRLVEVGLGRSDVVLEAPRQRVPERVDRAESRVAVGHALRDHAEGDEVVDVRELPALANHLLVDGPEVLGAARDLVSRETDAPELVIEDLDGSLGVVLALGARVLNHAGYALVLLGLEPEEGEVLELPLDARHAESVSEGRIHVHGLAGLEDAAIWWERRERPHVVEAVGELDDDHANVLRHCEEHLAEVEGLLLVHRGDLDGGELGDAVDELGHRGPEELGHLVERGGRVLDRVMEKRGADGVLVHVKVVGEDERHLDGVVDVGFAGAATLVAVELGGEAIGLRYLGALLLAEVGRTGLLEQAVVGSVRHAWTLSRRRGRSRLICHRCLPPRRR